MTISLDSEHFESLCNRYYNYVIHVYNKNFEQVRDKELVNNLMEMTDWLNLRSFDNEYQNGLYDCFEFLWKTGSSIEEILAAIEPIKQRHLSKKEDLTVKSIIYKYYRILFFIKTPLLKQVTYYNQKGDIIRKTIIDYTPDFKQLFKIFKTKAPEENVQKYLGAKETNVIDNHIYFENETTVHDQKSKELTPETTDRHLYYQALVKCVVNLKLDEYAKTKKKESKAIYPQTTKPSLDKENEATTTYQQVLAIYYMLHAMKINWQYINKADFARLVHFITGREIPMNIDNSNVYKKIKSLLGFNHKRNYNDLCKVYEVFKSIRTESEIWDDLLDSIKNDIESFEH